MIIHGKEMESGIKRRLIQTLILRFLDRNKIQVGISRSMEPLLGNTTSIPKFYMGKRPTSFGIESDDKMTLTRE